MIVTTDEFRIGFLRPRFAATIRADIDDCADLDDDWPEIIRWLRRWTADRSGKAAELNIIILADRKYHSKIIPVVKSDLPPNESEFATLVRDMAVRLTVFDHDGDSTLDWTYPDSDA